MLRLLVLMYLVQFYNPFGLRSFLFGFEIPHPQQLLLFGYACSRQNNNTDVCDNINTFIGKDCYQLRNNNTRQITIRHVIEESKKSTFVFRTANYRRSQP